MRVPYEFENPLCRETAPELFYPEMGEDPSNIALVKSICGRCSHLADCAEWGIAKERYGIWGALTPKDRDRVRMKRSLVLSEEEEEVA
jgi:hypothetical protein